jgi:hypothetical protein
MGATPPSAKGDAFARLEQSQRSSVVEQSIRNRQVKSSSLFAGSSWYTRLTVARRSDQLLFR